MSKIVCYFRQSTTKQERIGWGMAAQKADVRAYVKRTGAEVIGRFTETASGRDGERPHLRRALAKCRRERATLVVASLSRLGRDVVLLRELERSKIKFVALDCEHANKLTIAILMAVAENESDLVRERTRKAIAERRKSGKSVGAENPRCRNLTAKAAKAGRKLGAAANAKLADEAYADILPDMLAWREREWTLAQIAERMNNDGHTTRTGVAWGTSTVANVLRRGV